jgi:hypothetical protein
MYCTVLCKEERKDSSELPTYIGKGHVTLAAAASVMDK